jgi:ubiquinone/menaquinone biosynthesis C-methylase UbiE
MTTTPTKSPPPNRLLQLAAILVIIFLGLGCAFPSWRTWIGAAMTVWFLGTLTARHRYQHLIPRGFLVIWVIALIPALVRHWNKLDMPGVVYAAWMLSGALISVLSYLFHRLASPRLRGFASTLPLPLWGAAFQMLGQLMLPAGVFSVYSLAETQKTDAALMQVAALMGTNAVAFLIYWFAAVANWMWDQEFRWKKIAGGMGIFGVVFVVAFGFGLLRQAGNQPLPQDLPSGAGFGWTCLVFGAGLSGWAFLWPVVRDHAWLSKPEIVALLRSPGTGEPLRVVSERGHEIFVNASNERFPIRDGIPVFLREEELAGSNMKYKRFYRTIADFYDFSQRAGFALFGIDRDRMCGSFLPFLGVKPGDVVLETSVGTGLWFNYLPRDARLFGLDLSPEMLANCQANLRRWEVDACLFNGNAENLPFADNTFDVVFHVGGINFFSDRGKAIREMIRVAKPGSRIVISDETEKLVKEQFERTPVASVYYAGRTEAVSAPADLVPPEMLEKRLEIIWDERAYVLTFRKPDRDQSAASGLAEERA